MRSRSEGADQISPAPLTRLKQPSPYKRPGALGDVELAENP